MLEQLNFFQPPVMTITALTSYLRELLETDEVLRDIWVRGEISNCVPARSGHLYFTLKDVDAQIRCVMWKSSAIRLKFEPRDGLSIEAHGSMSIYPASGNVQLYIDSMRMDGEGILFQDFLRLKARLEAEGLFDAAHKRPIPELPRHIGLVTSASGAALQDMLNTLARRLPGVRVSLAPTAVQGVDAPAGIVRSLRLLNRLSDLDVILLARGGGSIEDLWSFNDEAVAHAVYGSRVPVISGVGHETDFTIVDFVADLRAPTPTAAAELATPITQADLREAVKSASVALDGLAAGRLSALRHALNLANADLLRCSPRQRVNNALQRQDDQRARLDRAMLGQLQRLKLQLENHLNRLEALSPLAVLGRGYAIVTKKPSGTLLRSTSQAEVGGALSIRLLDGSLDAEITHLNPGETHA